MNSFSRTAVNRIVTKYQITDPELIELMLSASLETEIIMYENTNKELKEALKIIQCFKKEIDARGKLIEELQKMVENVLDIKENQFKFGVN